MKFNERLLFFVVAGVKSKKIALFQPNGEFSVHTYLQKDIRASFSSYSICLWISFYRFRGDKNVPFCYGNKMIPDLLFIGILLENTFITEIEFNI